MATRRRIGVSAATTEAARRQLMQQVPSWEKVWVSPTNLPAGSSLRVYKWIKTDKVQQFSDEEGEVDEPLAPLPDEVEVVDGDEEMDQEETLASQTAPTEGAIQDDFPSKPPSPKPQLSMSLLSSEGGVDTEADVLDASLKPLDAAMDDDDDEEGGEKKESTDGIELDISTLGPDGLRLESSEDLSQLDAQDALISGSLMDESEDPFAENS